MRRALALALLAAAAGGCVQKKTGSSSSLPAGDAVWFEDGLSAAADDVETALLRAGLEIVFFPVARLTRQESHWEVQQLPPPPKPFARPKVFLVVGGNAEVEETLARRETIGPLANAVWLAIKGALADTRPYGSIGGVHLDLPFSARTLEGYGALVTTLRTKMPRGTLLSVSLRFSPGAEDQEKIKPLIASCDGFVAFVFGEGNRADPLSVDGLEKQWWAGYAPSARGVWQSTSGENRRALPEWVFGRLSDDPHTEFLQNVSLKEESSQSFELRPRSPVSLGQEFSFAAGDRILFQQPLVSDLIYRLGADLAGRRFARGRVIAFPGRSEAERLFTFATLSDVLLGKPVKPDLHVKTEEGRGFVAVSAENLSPNATVVSRTSNWVEVEIPSGRIRDVQTGGFDRFEVYGSDHQAITLGLATIVRFYETLVQPHEKIEPARILLHGPAPRGCCRTRFHLLAASGQEISSETAGAPPPQQ